VMMRRTSKETGDGVGNVRDYFMPVVRPRECALQIIKRTTEARAVITPLWLGMMRPGNREIGDGVRTVRDCFTLAIRPRVRALLRPGNKQAGDGARSARECFTLAAIPKEYVLWTGSCMTDTRAPITPL
jgi:hypothetical protein